MKEMNITPNVTFLINSVCELSKAGLYFLMRTGGFLYRYVSDTDRITRPIEKILLELRISVFSCCVEVCLLFLS